MNIKVANNINNKYVKLKLKINLVGKYTPKPTGIIVCFFSVFCIGFFL